MAVSLCPGDPYIIRELYANAHRTLLRVLVKSGPDKDPDPDMFNKIRVRARTQNLIRSKPGPAIRSTLMESGPGPGPGLKIDKIRARSSCIQSGPDSQWIEFVHELS